MPAGQAAAGIAVMHQPVVAAGRADQYHDVTAAGRRHSGRRRGTGKFPDPVGCEIQLRPRLAEHVARCFAAAKRTRTAGGPPADDSTVAIGIDDLPGIDRGHRRISAGRQDPVRAALLIADDHARATALRMTNPLTTFAAALSLARLPALLPTLLPHSAFNSCLDGARHMANRRRAKSSPIAMRMPGLRHSSCRARRIARRGPKIRTAAVVADDRRVIDAVLLVSGFGLGRNRSRDRNDRNEKKYRTFKQ